VNASRRPSRDAAHHSGSGRMASPSPWGTFTSDSLPAFLAHSEQGHNRPVTRQRAKPSRGMGRCDNANLQRSQSVHKDIYMQGAPELYRQPRPIVVRQRPAPKARVARHGIKRFRELRPWSITSRLRCRAVSPMNSANACFSNRRHRTGAPQCISGPMMARCRETTKVLAHLCRFAGHRPNRRQVGYHGNVQGLRMRHPDQPRTRAFFAGKSDALVHNRHGSKSGLRRSRHEEVGFVPESGPLVFLKNVNFFASNPGARSATTPT